MFKMCEVIDYIVAIFLIKLAFDDWKTKKVSVWILILMTVVMVVSRIFFVSMSIWETLGGIIIGTLSFLISKAGEEAIGYGDSWIVFLLGLYLGGVKLLELIFVASLLGCIFSVGKILRGGWYRKSTIPYIPFLTIAYIGGVLF